MFLPWPVDDIQKHGTLGVQGRGLVGLTAENVKRGLVDRALLQQGLSQDDDLFLVIGVHDSEEDGDGGGLQPRRTMKGGGY